MVEDLDRSIGKVLSALRRSGQLENTVVFFASDNVREQADLARHRPQDLGALRSAWEAVNATLLPYPG